VRTTSWATRKLYFIVSRSAGREKDRQPTGCRVPTEKIIGAGFTDAGSISMMVFLRLRLIFRFVLSLILILRMLLLLHVIYSYRRPAPHHLAPSAFVLPAGPQTTVRRSALCLSDVFTRGDQGDQPPHRLYLICNIFLSPNLRAGSLPLALRAGGYWIKLYPPPMTKT